MDGGAAAASSSEAEPATCRAGERLSPAEQEPAPALEQGGASPPSPPRGARRQQQHGVKRHHHKHNLKHRYEFLETLGKGTYGKVKRARERSGRLVAIKSIRKDRIKDEEDLVHIRREIEVMSSLSHPHIISIYEVFENSSKIVIVMEYASGGDLYDYISERQRLTEQEARHVFRQIVSAMYYCHKNGIVHRDLKLENILLDLNGSVKIADFGLSNVYQHDRYLQTYCGSPLYASPEIVNGRPYKGPEVDSWSLGVLLYILVHGAMPFDGQDYRNLVKQISSGEYRDPGTPSEACGLIRWMLMVNPDRRATIEDIANHWWVNWGYKTPVGEVESLRDSESPLAAVAEWLRRSSRPLLENSSKVRCFLRQHMPGVTLERQRSLKKSRKESDACPSSLEGNTSSAATQSPAKSILKRPQGILKKKQEVREEDLPGEQEPPSVFSARMVPVSQTSTACVPKKGILKKPPQRESGYCSSSEPSGQGDCIDQDPPVFHGDSSAAGASSEVPFRRKGILKRNGKFSSSPDASGAGYFNELAFLRAPLSLPRSRPASAVSEDSILSTESFEQLDLPESRGMRSCVSADDLLQLEQEEGGVFPPCLRHMDCYQSHLGDSCFSLTDCENVTDVYRTAFRIGLKLS
ncbi:NUAK family SNF1-like kinase 2 [Rhinatrema bivittatum]|uniref:NUAK family SNF1-like kinase 2 n=1 Tax=Rhinatrema bivittatum TaxID=194408 RepID=UPI00112EE943|nr:NUAK family SNF1-like kinase 2 [Rhinatrema bivittatum]